MQKHDVKNATTGTSGTQQPSKKVDTDLNNKKPMQKPSRSDDGILQDDDFNSPSRSK